MEEYKLLNYYYDNLADFVDLLAQETQDFVYDDVYVYSLINDSTLTEGNITSFLQCLYKVIYEYYKRDSIAYLDADYFKERLIQTIVEKLGEYIVKYNVLDILTNFESKTRYDDTSIMTSTTDETAHSGSSVVQSSASTPTGVTPEDTGKEITVNITTGENGTTGSFTDNTFADKYTNFQGTTNGVHENSVGRESDISRKGSLKDIIELQNMLPKSLLYGELLKDVSKHFIYLYE